MNRWPFGAVPDKRTCPARSVGPAARPIAPSATRLVHARPAAAGRPRSSAASARLRASQSVHSSNPVMATNSDHGVTHATSMSHCTASRGVAELK